MPPEDDAASPEGVVPAVLERPATASSLAPSASQDGAEPDPNWTLETVLRFALRHQPVLLARQYEVNAARARLLGVGLLPNPRLVVDSETPTHGGPTELDGRITFEIPLAAKRHARKAVACAGIQRAKVALSRETENVLLEAADAAVEVLYLQDLLKLREQISQLAAKKAESKVPDLGRQTKRLDLSDRLKADIEAANREAERLDAENRLRVARLRLSRAIGLTPSTELRMEGHLAVDSLRLEPLESMLAKSERTGLLIDEASAALTESQQRYRLAWAEAIPNPELGPTYRDELGTTDKQIGARFATDLPIFDRNQDEICQRGSEIQASRALLDAATGATRADVASAYAELESLRDSLTALETGAMERLRSYEDLLRDPNARKGITETQVLEVSQRSLELKVQHLELRYRFVRLSVRLEILLGSDVTPSQ